MYRALAYALVAILMACFLGLALAPISSGVNAVMHRISRTLRTTARS